MKKNTANIAFAESCMYGATYILRFTVMEKGLMRKITCIRVTDMLQSKLIVFALKARVATKKTANHGLWAQPNQTNQPPQKSCWKKGGSSAMRQVFHKCNASLGLSQLEICPDCFYFLVHRYSIIESSTCVELESQWIYLKTMIIKFCREGVGCKLLLLMFWQWISNEG